MREIIKKGKESRGTFGVHRAQKRENAFRTKEEHARRER